MFDPNSSGISMNFENEMDITDKLTKENLEFKDTIKKLEKKIDHQKYELNEKMKIIFSFDDTVK